MAIAFTAVRVNSGAAATSFTSASFTPSANELLIAFMSARTSAAAIPSITDSLGNTWTLVPGTNISGGAGGIKGSMYYWQVGASPSAMTVTVTSAGAIGCSLLVVGYTGGDTDTSNVGVNSNAAGDPAPSAPSAMATTSTGLAFSNQNAGAAPTATPSAQGYSSVVNSLPATNLRHTLFTDNASPAQSVSWVSTGTDSIGVLWELKEAGGGPSPISGTIVQAISRAAQAASGTVTAAPAITGTIAQAISAAAQNASGTVGTVPAITGTIAQATNRAAQNASGTVAAAGAITGTVAQTTSIPAQSATGSVTAAVAVAFQPGAFQAHPAFQTPVPDIVAAVAQTIGRASQAAVGTVAAAGAVIGVVAQTAPSARQSASGVVKSNFVNLDASAAVNIGTTAQVNRAQALVANSSISIGASAGLSRSAGFKGQADANILAEGDFDIRHITYKNFEGFSDIDVDVYDHYIYIGYFWVEQFPPEGSWGEVSDSGDFWVPITPANAEWRRDG